jgi:hypothetical protein
MTVSSDLNRISYSGNGSTTLFPVNYYFLENTHLQVILISASGVETIQTLTTNYTVSGAGNPAGGSVTMLVPPPSGTTLVIQRDVPATQETDYLANDPFPAESHERALDKLTMLVQQNERESGRALKIPLAAVPTTSTELPLPVGNKLLAWNSNASAVINLDPSDVITVTGQQNSYGDVFTGNGVTTDFTLTRNPGSVFNIDVSINGVTQVPNVDYILNATTLTFTSAPPAVASQVLARYSEVFTLNDADAANVRYLPAGSGAQLTNVQAKLRETVSVKDFGAVGDGVTDDTAAIQAAIDSGAKEVVFPAGSYVVDGLVGASDQVLNGQGAATLLAKTGALATYILFNYTSKVNYHVKGFVFDGVNLAASNLKTSVYNNLCTNAKYTDNIWKNFNGIGIFFGNSSYVNVDRNVFDNIGVYNFVTSDPADRKQAIAFMTCSYCTANDNLFKLVGLDCISYATNCEYVEACRNITEDNYASAIYVSLTNQFVITDNISNAKNVSGVMSGNGIDVVNSKNGTISNNVCTNRGATGILAVNVFGVSITGNVCKNNVNNGSTTANGGIKVAASSSGGFTPLTEYVTLSGNTCYDDRDPADVTQRVAVQRFPSGGTINNLVIDQSNNLQGYNDSGNPQLSRRINPTFGLIGYPILFNLNSGATFDLCDSDRYLDLTIVQTNNTSFYASFYLRPNSTPIKIFDNSSEWEVTDTGSKQSVLYDAGSGKIQVKNNTGLTRSYLVITNSGTASLT